MINRYSKFFRFDLKRNFPLIILSVAALCLIVVFVCGYVAHEKYVYFYDYATYFNLYSELGAKFSSVPFKALDSISVSVRKAEYNNSGVVALMPFYFIFGAGRTAYISAIAVTYVFPILLFFPFLTGELMNRRIGENRAERTLFFSVGVISFGFLPQLWIPVLLGFIDVVGVGVIFTIFYLFFKKKLAEQSRKQLILLGFLVCFTVILRRWYAYWAVGFFAAAAVYEFLEFWRQGKNLKSLKNSFLRIFVIGLSAVLIFFAVSSKIAVAMLQTDYREQYSAFRSHENIFQAFEQLYSYFGLIFTFSAAAGLIIMLARKELRARAIFFAVLFVVAFCLFTRTQDIGWHHYYWVISILSVFSAVFVVEIFRRLAGNRSKAAFAAVLLVVCAGNFAVVFVPKAETVLQPFDFALPKVRLYTKVRNDFEQLHELLLALNSLTENSDKKIYVLSSSINSNSGVLQNAPAQFEPELRGLKNKILRTSDIDLRDGFPFQLYEADYVVVAEPISGPLSLTVQKVVTIPAEQISNNQNIGAAYAKLPLEFVLDGGEKIFIYQKQRKFTREELEKMSQLFVALFPENREKFEIDDEKLKQFSEN